MRLQCMRPVIGSVHPKNIIKPLILENSRFIFHVTLSTIRGQKGVLMPYCAPSKHGLEAQRWLSMESHSLKAVKWWAGKDVCQITIKFGVSSQSKCTGTILDTNSINEKVQGLPWFTRQNHCNFVEMQQWQMSCVIVFLHKVKSSFLLIGM